MLGREGSLWQAGILSTEADGDRSLSLPGEGVTASSFQPSVVNQATTRLYKSSLPDKGNKNSSGADKRPTDGLHISQNLLADCWSPISRLLAICRPTVGRLSAVCRPTVGLGSCSSQ